jgi:hypothetical protein
VHSIDQYGKVEIYFSEGMNTELFTNSSLKMYVVPFENWHIYQDGFDLANLNFTWTMVSFEGDILTLKMNFTNPSQISPGDSFDELAIHFEGYFASSNGVILSTRYLSYPLKRQLADTLAIRSYQSVSSASSGAIVSTFIISIFINMFLAGVMSLLVGLLNSMQLIVHLPIMLVAFPANVMICLRVMMPIAMFDILEYKGSIMSYVGIEGAEEGSSEVLDIPDQM